MSEKIQWAVNHMPKSDDAHLGIMSLDNVKKARAFHKSFPQYTVTPLARLDGQAARLGLGNVIQGHDAEVGIIALGHLVDGPLDLLAH